MIVRLTLSAAALVTFASSAVAGDPAKSDWRDAGQPAKSPKPLVLASAESNTAQPVADVPAPAPAKHRAARVTTCRCGDQQAQEDNE